MNGLENIRDEVRAAYPVPANLRRIVNLAAFDLYYGPIRETDDGKPWPGFCGTLKAVRAWLDARRIPSELWVDEVCGAVMDREPDRYYEDEDGNEVAECLDDVWHLERLGVLRALFGDNELASYI